MKIRKKKKCHWAHCGPFNLRPGAKAPKLHPFWSSPELSCHASSRVERGCFLFTFKRFSYFFNWAKSKSDPSSRGGPWVAAASDSRVCVLWPYTGRYRQVNIPVQRTPANYSNTGNIPDGGATHRARYPYPVPRPSVMLIDRARYFSLSPLPPFIHTTRWNVWRGCPARFSTTTMTMVVVGTRTLVKHRFVILPVRLSLKIHTFLISLRRFIRIP